MNDSNEARGFKPSVKFDGAAGREYLRSKYDSFYEANILPNFEDLDEEAKSNVDRVYRQIASYIDKLNDHVADILSEFVKRVTASDESWRLFVAKLDEAKKSIDYFLDVNPDLSVFDILKTGGAPAMADLWLRAAQQGWYISTVATFSGITSAIKGGPALDDFMVRHLDRNMDLFLSDALRLHPERVEIIKTAFELHKIEQYIASVPLFIMQADGVCAQNLGFWLFTDRDKRKEKVTKLAGNSSEVYAEAFFSGLLTKTQINESIDKAGPKDKNKGPNRNGIVHGSSKHLDYGSKINSYKAMSLFFFSVFLSESFKKYR